MLRIAFASLRNRRTTVCLTVLSIAVSVSLVLSVEKLRRDVRTSYASTISGVDLIAGARSSSIQLLLYSVFRIGNATNNISWDSYQVLKGDPRVAWTVPLSLGDSHRGYRVLGTTHEYFDHFRYGARRSLAFTAGAPFDKPLDAVLGAEVAKTLDLKLSDSIILSHGAGEVSFITHDDQPFTVVGVLERSGTAVDRTVHVSLAGIEAIHAGWKDGAPPNSKPLLVGRQNKEPEAITAFLIGLKSRTSVFRVQRRINEFGDEALSAILPGVALQELWDAMRVGENALRVVSIMVVVAGLLGMLVVILASLESRRREMAILRSVGASPTTIFGLFVTEALLLSAGGLGAGTALHYLAVWLAHPFAQAIFGVELSVTLPGTNDVVVLCGVLLGGLVAGLIPALKASRMSLNDGLSMRL